MSYLSPPQNDVAIKEAPNLFLRFVGGFLISGRPGFSHPMTLTAVGTLFPAIPLAIVALNFRYTSLAGLMREITSKLEPGAGEDGRRTVLIDELRVMKTRMSLVKYALFLCGLAFIFNLTSLYAGYFALGRLAPAAMALTIMAMTGGIVCFCIETVLSTKALNLHISGVLQRDLTD